MRFNHSPDASTISRLKLMQFVYIICCSERTINCTSFSPGYAQPSSDVFACDAFPLARLTHLPAPPSLYNIWWVNNVMFHLKVRLLPSWPYPQAGNTNWRRRLSTVDHLVLTSLDQLLFILKILFIMDAKRATLMRRSIVLSIPPPLS